MANKKEEEVKVTKKKNTNSNGKTTKKNTSTKTQTSKKSTNNTQKKNTAKKTASKSNTNKTSSVKKPTNKKSTTKKVIKKEEEIVLEKKQEFPDNFKEVDNNNNISKQEKDEKEIVEEINNVNSIKVEDSKFKKVKSKALLPVGIIIAILGLAALIVSLVANRIIDREFMSDTAITIMLVISIIIEAFGAFIIINES